MLATLPKSLIRRTLFWLPERVKRGARALWRETDGGGGYPCCCARTGSTSTRSTSSRTLMPPATSCASCCHLNYYLVASGAADRTKPGVDNTSTAQINCSTGCPGAATCTSYDGVFEIVNHSCPPASNPCGWSNIFGCVLCDQRSTFGSGSADYFGYWSLALSHLGSNLRFLATPAFFRKNLSDPCDFSHGTLQSFGCRYRYETAAGDLQCDVTRTLDFELVAPETCTIACTFPSSIQLIPVV